MHNDSVAVIRGALKGAHGKKAERSPHKMGRLHANGGKNQEYLAFNLAKRFSYVPGGRRIGTKL
jgi:hypothetical protein